MQTGGSIFWILDILDILDSGFCISPTIVS